MPIPRATKFTAFDFTEEERKEAGKLSQFNLMLLQTLAAEASEERLQLKLDLHEGKTLHEAQMLFMQREAELQGRIAAYEGLILLSQD